MIKHESATKPCVAIKDLSIFLYLCVVCVVLFGVIEEGDFYEAVLR